MDLIAMRLGFLRYPILGQRKGGINPDENDHQFEDRASDPGDPSSASDCRLRRRFGLCDLEKIRLHGG